MLRRLRGAAFITLIWVVSYAVLMTIVKLALGPDWDYMKMNGYQHSFVHYLLHAIWAGAKQGFYAGAVFSLFLSLGNRNRTIGNMRWGGLLLRGALAGITPLAIQSISALIFIDVSEFHFGLTEYLLLAASFAIPAVFSTVGAALLLSTARRAPALESETPGDLLE